MQWGQFAAALELSGRKEINADILGQQKCGADTRGPWCRLLSSCNGPTRPGINVDKLGQRKTGSGKERHAGQ
jgi:hypothetical protein